jgi:2-polyprenyl-6-hydroxyphenyl methylase/3-demethylubiquinone-9 3-methyltransferase
MIGARGKWERHVIDLSRPIVPTEFRCKICGSPAPLAGVVDFNKNCEQRRDKVLPLYGVPVYYHRCIRCKLLFTVAFDAFTPADFKRWIYNDQYIKVDPEYIDIRPRVNAKALSQLLGGHQSLRILDYGGGSGKLAALLREAGFSDVHSYDPFADEHSRRPDGRFDFICAFEVLEHTPTPRETLSDIVSLLRDPGLLMFTTLLQGRELEMTGINWWYIAPRNGHVTLYSRESLEHLAHELRYRFASQDEGMHILVRSIPPFAAGWFK